MRIVFMGTPDFAVPALNALEAIQSAVATPETPRIQLVGVYTQPDRPVGRGLEVRANPVKRRALELSLPIFQPEKLSMEGEVEKLCQLRPDLIVVVAFGQILKQNVLSLPRFGCINVHSSLLPRWRGAAPINWAILAGDSESGVTVQKMVLKLDAGDILIQKRTNISPGESAGALHDRLSLLGGEALIECLRGIHSGNLQSKNQDETGVTYASKLTKEMEQLDLSRSCSEVDRQIRGLTPWPGTSIWIELPDGTERVKIKKAIPHIGLALSGRQNELFDKAGMVLMGCSDGAIELQRLQQEGKKEVDAAGFLNGLKGRKLSLPFKIKTSAPS